MKLRLRAPGPAFVISLIALFVALGGTTAYASGLISGRLIVNHSVPAKKLTAAAINVLHGQRGPAGPGAISLRLDDIQPDSGLHHLATTHGIEVSYACTTNPDRIRFVLSPRSAPGHQTDFSGNYAQDGVLKAVLGHGGLDVDGRSTLNVQLIAWTGRGDGLVSRIDLGGIFWSKESGAGPACQLWGLVTRGTRPHGFIGQGTR
jgi:hypothetical protein